MILSSETIFSGKTFDLDANTLTGTLAEFNTALQSASFCSLAGSETLTNKTLTSPVLTSPVLTSPVLNTGVSGTAILDEDAMGSNSATKLATQQSIKAYVASQISTAATIGDIIALG